jgi:predicted transcriptional regulator
MSPRPTKNKRIVGIGNWKYNKNKTGRGNIETEINDISQKPTMMIEMQLTVSDAVRGFCDALRSGSGDTT